MRLRVRGSNASMKPVSRKLPASPRRQEIPVTGSANESATDQPPFVTHERCDRSVGGRGQELADLRAAPRRQHGNFGFLQLIGTSSRFTGVRTGRKFINKLLEHGGDAGTLDGLPKDVVGGRRRD